MSILAPTVALLSENDNRVLFDIERRPQVLTIDAVALITLRDTPRVMLFCKGFDEPLEMTTGFQMDPESRDGNMIPVVQSAGEMLYAFRRGQFEWKTHDELFAFLIAQTSPEFNLLSFAPVDPVCPHYHNNLEDTFDQVETFIDTTGFPQPARMLLQLQWTGREGRNHSEKPTKLRYGNVMIWSATSGNIFWVTRGRDGVVRALEIAGCVKDYSEMLTWVRQFRKDQWVVRGMYSMPYYLPKMSPKEDVVKEAPPEESPLLMLETLLSVKPGQLSEAAISLISAIVGKHFQPPKPVDRSHEYADLASETIRGFAQGKKAAPVKKALDEAALLVREALIGKAV